jgi:hypothetical protein
MRIASRAFDSDHRSAADGFEVAPSWSHDSGTELGSVYNLRFAHALSPSWMVGVQGGQFKADPDDSTSWKFSSTLLTATWHPGKSGFFLRGGAGIGSISAQLNYRTRWQYLDLNSTVVVRDTVLRATTSDDGFAAMAGVGWELALSKKLAVGPQVDVYWISTHDQTYAYFGHASLAVNLYW